MLLGAPVGVATRRCEGVLRTSRSVPSEAVVLEAQVHKRLQRGAPHSSVWPEFVNIGVQGRMSGDVVRAGAGRPSWSETAARLVVCDFRWSYNEIWKAPTMSRCRSFGRLTRTKKSASLVIVVGLPLGCRIIDSIHFS